MSHIDGTAVRIYSQQTGPRFVVLLTVADQIAKNVESTHRGRSYLARLAHMDERNFRRYREKLVEAGELILIDHPGHMTEYIIPLYPGEIGYDPQDCNATDHRCNGRHTPIGKGRLEKAIDAEDQRRARGGKTTPPKHQPGGVKLPLGGNATPPDGVNLPPLYDLNNSNDLNEGNAHATVRENSPSDDELDDYEERSRAKWLAAIERAKQQIPPRRPLTQNEKRRAINAR